MNYAKMLDEQIKKSEEFSQTKFGVLVGEDYPEFLKDVTQSEAAAGMAMIGMIGTIMFGRDIPKKEKEREIKTGKKSTPTEMIQHNLSAFETYYNFLYYGIQIGKEIAKQEAEVSALEKMVGL